MSSKVFVELPKADPEEALQNMARQFAFNVRGGKIISFNILFDVIQ